MSEIYDSLTGAARGVREREGGGVRSQVHVAKLASHMCNLRLAAFCGSNNKKSGCKSCCHCLLVEQREGGWGAGCGRQPGMGVAGIRVYTNSKYA